MSPYDPEGRGKTGGVCEVLWDWTHVRDCYRTGYKGEFAPLTRLLDGSYTPLTRPPHAPLSCMFKGDECCIPGEFALRQLDATATRRQLELTLGSDLHATEGQRVCHVC